MLIRLIMYYHRQYTTGRRCFDVKLLYRISCLSVVVESEIAKRVTSNDGLQALAMHASPS